MVEVGVENMAGLKPGSNGNATVLLAIERTNFSYTFNALFGIPEYEPT